MWFSFKRVQNVFLVIFSITAITSAAQYKTVETTNGPIRGIRHTTLLKDVPFYSFKGIPYAKPPVGDLRFKAPEPIESWAPTTLDAFEHSNSCIQFRGNLIPSSNQSEDCLTLNVYVPANIEPNKKLAVIFFTHGGGFQSGSGDDFRFGPDFIVEKKTILVTLNYRLGMLGFLSLDLPEYSGNMGLKDVQLALKWTNENIERFGGDSKRITIFGQSAGSVITHMQVLSSESRKYFRNAIMMSGSADHFWGINDGVRLKRAFDILTDFDEPMPITDHDELVNFLKSVSVEKLRCFTQPNPDRPFNYFFTYHAGPIVERKDAIQPFLIETPEKIYDTEKIDVDTIFTSTSIEMLVTPKPSSSVLKRFDAIFDDIVPFERFHLTRNSNTSRAIRKFYFGESPIDEEMLVNYYEFLSDLRFVYGIDRSVKKHLSYSKGKTYYGWFAMDSALNGMKRIVGNMNLPGTAHADELCYIFKCSRLQKQYNRIKSNAKDEELITSYRLIKHITTLFTNFAKYGEPSHQNQPIESFPPAQENSIHFLHISNDGLKMDIHPRKEAMEFWDKLQQESKSGAAVLRIHVLLLLLLLTIILAFV